MKKSLFSIAIATTLIAVIFTGCQSTDDKREASREKVQDAKEDLRDVQKDADIESQKVAIAKEWQIFKSESQSIISENEKRIDELKVKLKKTGNRLDAQYEKRIDILEQKNKALKAELENYEKSQSSDWETFKREFNHGMDEIGQAFKDLVPDQNN